MNILFCLTPKEKVAYIYSDSTIRQALEKMQVYRYSAIPVLDRDGAYVGTISEGDLLWFIKEMKLDFEKTEQMGILEVPRNKTNASVMITANMEDIIDISTQQNFVPVVDDYGSFIGIITRKDIFNYMVDRMNIKEQIALEDN
ncbi:MAG: CBS domain-containing protein [Acholeplasmataceae bacterium]